MTKSSFGTFYKFHPNRSASHRVFIFPHAGGGVANLNRIAEKFSSNVDVIGVQLPGRERRHREEMLTFMPDVIDHLLQEVEEIDERPFVFYGHSLGALIAYEFAIALHNQHGVCPCHLLVSGMNSPSVLRMNVDIPQISDDMLIDFVIGFGGIPNMLLSERSYLRAMAPLLRSDLSLVSRYAYEDKGLLPCPITAFYGKDDSNITKEGIEMWGRLTSSSYDYRYFDGGHFFSEQGLKMVLEYVNGVCADRQGIAVLSECAAN